MAPERITVERRESIDTIRYRWRHTDDWTPQQLGVVCHAEAVRVYPFTDGNGRSTRLFADLVLVAAQDSDSPALYDWQLDKSRYIELLRQYDRHRDPGALAAFIKTRRLGE